MPLIVAERFQIDNPVAGIARGFDLLTGSDVQIEALPLGTDDSPRERLAALSRRLAEFHHPGLVPLRAIHLERNICYIVSDLVPGARLADLSGPMDLPILLPAVQCLTSTLADMHALGHTHGHISPHAILLSDTGQVLLYWLDIIGLHGAARLYSRSGVTAVGGSPEEDMHALGAVIYRQVTGLPQSDSGSIGQMMEAMFRQCLTLGLPASDWRPDLPAGWDWFLRRATAASPLERFPSMAAMAESAHALSSDLPPSEPAPAPQQVSIPRLPAALPRLPVARPQLAPPRLPQPSLPQPSLPRLSLPRPSLPMRRLVAVGSAVLGALLLTLVAVLLLTRGSSPGRLHNAQPRLAAPHHLDVSGPRPVPPYTSPALVTLRWSAVPGASSYRIVLGALKHHRNGRRTPITLWHRTVTHPWLTLTLLGARSYLWRVAALSGTLLGPYSPGQRFLVNRPPLTAPTGLHATTSAGRTTFCWKPVMRATSYLLHVNGKKVTTPSRCASASLPAGRYTWMVTPVARALRAYRGPSSSATVRVTG